MRLTNGKVWIRSPANSPYTQQRACGSYATTSSGASYFHIETSVPANSNAMFMFEAVGHAYRRGPIRCAWCGYPYSPSNAVINQSSETAYGNSALDAQGSYYSADGWVTLKAYCADSYYMGFILNAYPTAGNGTGRDSFIRRVVRNTDGSNI